MLQVESLLELVSGLVLFKHDYKQTNKDSSMTSNDDELLYYMLGQVNQERDWDLPQALCATDRCHWQREREPKILRYLSKAKTACSTTISISSGSVERGCNRPKN